MGEEWNVGQSDGDGQRAQRQGDRPCVGRGGGEGGEASYLLCARPAPGKRARGPMPWILPSAFPFFFQRGAHPHAHATGVTHQRSEW